MEKLTGVERLNYEKEVTAPFLGKFSYRTIFNFLWASLIQFSVDH